MTPKDRDAVAALLHPELPGVTGHGWHRRGDIWMLSLSCGTLRIADGRRVSFVSGAESHFGVYKGRGWRERLVERVVACVGVVTTPGVLIESPRSSHQTFVRDLTALAAKVGRQADNNDPDAVGPE